MTLRSGHLRYFVTVADEGQITRAAARLHIAQPALSQAIASLEDEVGFPLLERHSRGVTVTPAGELFLSTARKALRAEEDAVRTAAWLARAASGTIEFGFVGAPPGLDSPGPLAAFAQAHPETEIRYRELSFPGRDTSAWLSDVDFAVCHLPPQDDHVWTQVLRQEPRVILAKAGDPLAARGELRVADVLDRTFIGMSPLVDPSWAGFWSLDDHRGRPAELTQDHAANPQEVLAALSVRDAITVVPASVADVIVNVLAGLRAIPITDAAPTTIVFAGHAGRRNALVDTLMEFAGRIGDLGREPADP
jgi:DNA-binding transcriptional LysR family regulator